MKIHSPTIIQKWDSNNCHQCQEKAEYIMTVSSTRLCGHCQDYYSKYGFEIVRLV